MRLDVVFHSSLERCEAQCSSAIVETRATGRHRSLRRRGTGHMPLLLLRCDSVFSITIIDSVVFWTTALLLAHFDFMSPLLASACSFQLSFRYFTQFHFKNKIPISNSNSNCLSCQFFRKTFRLRSDRLGGVPVLEPNCQHLVKRIYAAFMHL